MSGLAAVLVAPDDDAPRLVYADWLLERDDPRGELIQVQCRLAAGEDRHELRAREQELLAAHERTWTDPLYGDVPRPAQAGQLARDERSLLFRFRRGFVWQVSGSIEAFARRGAAIFAAEPVRSLDLTSHGLPFKFAGLPPPPHGLDSFAFKGFLPDDQAALLAASAPHLAGIRSLYLWGGILLGNDGIRALAQSPHLGALEDLVLRGTMVNDDGARILAATRAWPRLRRLGILAHQIRDAGAVELAAACTGLEELYFDRGLISQPCAAELAARHPNLTLWYTADERVRSDRR